MRAWLAAVLVLCLLALVRAQSDNAPVIEQDLKAERVPLKTDDDVVKREEASIRPSGGYTEDELKLLEETRELHSFQSDVAKTMHLIIHNVYSNRDVFLRELVSNASDVCIFSGP